MENSNPQGAMDDSAPTAFPSAGGENAGGEKVAAWEMIEIGRYQPRRIKGSLLGRELG